jgi:N-methylhydantoinase B
VNAPPERISAALTAQMLDATAREIGAIVEHASSSRYFQTRDMATSIFDRQGRLVGQAEYLPIMAFALRPQLQGLLAMFGDDIHEGDGFVTSDVYHGGNQSLDVAVFVPVFVSGELEFWTAAKGHVADLGGTVAGGYALGATEVWQENIRVPPLRLVKAGRRLEDRWTLIAANCRTPDLLARDVAAMLGACARGAHRLQRFCAEGGVDNARRSVDDLLAITEASARQSLAEFRPGAYAAEAILPAAAGGSERASTARLRLHLSGDGTAHFDFAGTDPQLPSIANSPVAATVSAVLCALFMCVPPEIARNEGWLEVVCVDVPEGSFLNPRPPAATQTGNFTANNTAAECVLKVLAQAAPQSATAGWAKCLGSTFTATGHRGELAIDSAFFNNKGGSGACHGFDGFDHIGAVILGGGSLANDYERFEAQNPYLVLLHELWCDSAGAGRWRGGFGTRSEVLIEADDCTLTLHGDASTRPHGILGGCDAPANRYVLEFPSGETAAPKGLARWDLPRGTVVRNWNSGGGGYGAPRERVRAAVEADLSSGLVSDEAAQKTYGLE